MSPPNTMLKPPSRIVSYHAHIYYEPQSSRDTAEWLRERIAERFSVQLGRWHDKPIGPHVRAMYQVAFEPQVFERFVPWLMLNRQGLSILVHPNTLAPRDDHLVHALWLGERLAINEQPLPVSIDASLESPIVPNTAPGVAPE